MSTHPRLTSMSHPACTPRQFVQCPSRSFATSQVASPALGVPEHGRSRFLQPSRAHHGLDSSALPPQNAAQAKKGGAHGRRGGDGEDLDRADVFLGTGPCQDRRQEVVHVGISFFVVRFPPLVSERPFLLYCILPSGNIRIEPFRKVDNTHKLSALTRSPQQLSLNCISQESKQLTLQPG